MSPYPKKCEGCPQPITKKADGVICSACNKQYHISCVATGLGKFPHESPLAWKCPNCKPRTSNADNSPIRTCSVGMGAGEDGNITYRKKGTPPASPTVEIKGDPPVTVTAVRDIVKGEISGLLKHLNETIANFVNRELKSIKDEITSVNESMKFMNEKYEDMRTELKSKFVLVNELQKENIQLKTTVKELNGKVNLLEQHARSCNLEIQCLPEHRGENLVSTVTNLGRVISCGITDANIHNVTRIAKQNPNSARAKSIIVQFNSPRVRDEFLAASIKFNKSNPDNKLNSHILGIGGPKQNVYIMEHLSPANKSLHAAARIKAKEKTYKFVWIRNGKIFMRKTENSEYKYIKDHDTLEKLE